MQLIWYTCKIDFHGLPTIAIAEGLYIPTTKIGAFRISNVVHCTCQVLVGFAAESEKENLSAGHMIDELNFVRPKMKKKIKYQVLPF